MTIATKVEVTLEPHPAWIGVDSDHLHDIKFSMEPGLETIYIPRACGPTLIYKRSGEVYDLWGIEEGGVCEATPPAALVQIKRLAVQRQRAYREKRKEIVR